MGKFNTAAKGVNERHLTSQDKWDSQAIKIQYIFVYIPRETELVFLGRDFPTLVKCPEQELQAL